MSQHQHTAGPWEVGSEGVSGGYANIYSAGESAIIGSATAEDVGDDQANANARLIAAAPDLLAACKRADVYLSMNGILSDQSRAAALLNTVQMLASAIEKAEDHESVKS